MRDGIRHSPQEHVNQRKKQFILFLFLFHHTLQEARGGKKSGLTPLFFCLTPLLLPVSYGMEQKKKKERNKMNKLKKQSNKKRSKMKIITIPKRIIPEHKINLYRFEELDNDIKEQLQVDYRNNLYKYGYNWKDELYHSIQTACKIFGVDFEEDTYGNLYITYQKNENLNRNTARNMNFKRAIAYINNHFDFKCPRYHYKYKDTIAKWDKLTKIKLRYDKRRKEILSKFQKPEKRYNYYNKYPYPNILLESYYKNEQNDTTYYARPIETAINKMDDNLPTGYCEDYVIHETYQEFIKKAQEYKPPTNKHTANDFYSLEDFLDMLITNFKKARDNDREYQESQEYIQENIYYDTWFLKDGTIWEK